MLGCFGIKGQKKVSSAAATWCQDPEQQSQAFFVLECLPGDDVAQHVNSSVANKCQPTLVKTDDRSQAVVRVFDNQKVFLVQFIVSVIHYVQQDGKVEQNLLVGNGNFKIAVFFVVAFSVCLQTEGWVMISSSPVKQLRTDSATDWNMSFGQSSGLSLLRSIRAKKLYPMPCKWHKQSQAFLITQTLQEGLTFMRYNRAVLSQSLPLTSFGTIKSVANFSVSVAAAIKARRHFFTGSET